MYSHLILKANTSLNTNTTWCIWTLAGTALQAHVTNRLINKPLFPM